MRYVSNTENNVDYALTTIDNPYNPFEDFGNWFRYDTVTAGHNTCDYLDKIANTSDALTDEENQKEIERAMKEIIAENPTNIYIRVNSDSYKDKTGPPGSW